MNNESETLPYPELLSLLLKNRGIETVAQAEKFLHPSYESDLYDPFLFSDMERACVRIFEAVQADESIVIYSDYDCDGIPGAVVLSDFFKKINYPNVEVYIPDRHDEGYGLHEEAVREFSAKNVKLLITIDLGITAVSEVALAQGFGIDVILTDHHLPPVELPRPYALINPKVGNYPYTMLCGAGVAFKLVQGLITKYGEYWNIPTGWEKWLLDMVGIATLSDMVPLQDENRALAYYGLAVLRKNRRLGLARLLKKMNIDSRTMVEDDITFMIAPRLNAASRMDNPLRAFELLSTTDEGESDVLASHLTSINDERKTIVATIMREVKKSLEKREDKELIVIGNPKWRVGVLGLVASKIVEEYDRPAFVWGFEGDEENSEGMFIKGSCRSNGAVNVVSLMREIKPEIMANFGGHELAGGFSVPYTQIHFLEAELLSSYHSVAVVGEEQSKEVFYDTKLPLEEVTLPNYRLIEKMAPFGMDNPKPTFLFESVLLAGVKTFGKEKNHLELILENNKGKFVKAIKFFATESSFDFPLVAGGRINLLATFELSYFAGRTELRLRIVDILK